MLESGGRTEGLNRYVSDSQETTLVVNAENPEVFIQLQSQMSRDL